MKVVIVLMIIQVILFGLGVYYLIAGMLTLGLFHVILNTACFALNIGTLKRLRVM